MSFLVDNANTWYVLFAIIAIGFGAMWWSQRRPRLLIGAAVGVGLIVLLWLLTRFVVSDRRQIEINVRELASAATEGKTGVIVQHLASDFEFQGCKRQAAAEGVTREAKAHLITDIQISSFDVDELQERTAKASFNITVHSQKLDHPIPLQGHLTLVKEEGRWKVKSARFSPRAGGVPIQVPIFCN